MVNNSEFNGPVFIVGLPRSGTKLIRDLLNRHPDVFIPPNESKIIPYLANKYGLELSDTMVDEVITEWLQSTFSLRLSNKGYSINKNEWKTEFRSKSSRNIASLFASFYTKFTKEKGGKIWGDKTPTYLRHYPLLMKMYPNAKFIHIVRDVRDQSLSVKKTWGKHLIRSAYRWNESLNIFMSQISGGNVFHIKYEELIGRPNIVLDMVCIFLGIEFTDRMLILDSSTEEYGDAQGITHIKTDNSLKWTNQLTNKEVCKIERICSDMMDQFGYEKRYYFGESIKLSLVEKNLFKLYDGFNLFIFHFRRIGSLKNTLKFLIRDYTRRVG